MKVQNTLYSTSSDNDPSQHSVPSANHFDEKNLQGSLENGEVTEFYYLKLLRLEYCLIFVVTINILIMIVVESLTFPNIEDRNQAMVDLGLIFNLICAIVQMVLLYFRAGISLCLEKEQKRIYEKASLFSTRKLFYLFLEYAIIIIQPYWFFRDLTFPTQDAFDQVPFDMPVNDLLTILGLARFYILLRTLLLLTPYMNNRCTCFWYIANRLCKMYGCRADFGFSLKCLFKDSPLFLIGFFFTVSALLFGYALYIAQRRLTLYVPIGTTTICNNYPNALWLIVISITTVGYGDYFPHTTLGRIIILFVAIWGTFIISIMVVVVANTLDMEKNQKRTLLVLQKLTTRDELKQCAAKLIGFFVLYKRHQSDPVKGPKYRSILRTQKKQFSDLRKKIKLMSGCDDIYDEIATHFLNLNSDIEILNQNQENIINFLHDRLQYNEKEKQ